MLLINRLQIYAFLLKPPRKIKKICVHLCYLWETDFTFLNPHMKTNGKPTPKAA